MRETFDGHDSKNEGVIKASLLGNILRTLGFNPLDSDIQQALKDFDPQSKFVFFFVFVFDLIVDLETDQLKFPEYVAAVLSVPTRVLDKDIIPAFQVFDIEKRGVLEADEILKSLATVGEKLDEEEVNAFKENITINEMGLFDYNGKTKFQFVFDISNFYFYFYRRILSEIYSTTTNENEEKRKKEEEEKINFDEFLHFLTFSLLKNTFERDHQTEIQTKPIVCRIIVRNCSSLISNSVV